MVVYLCDRISRRCNRGQNWVLLPAVVGVDGPVRAQHEHQNDDQNPEQFSDHRLVRLEDVDETLDGRVFGIVSNDFEHFVSSFSSHCSVSYNKSCLINKVILKNRLVTPVL